MDYNEVLLKCLENGNIVQARYMIDNNLSDFILTYKIIELVFPYFDILKQLHKNESKNESFNKNLLKRSILESKTEYVDYFIKYANKQHIDNIFYDVCDKCDLKWIEFLYDRGAKVCCHGMTKLLRQSNNEAIMFILSKETYNFTTDDILRINKNCNDELTLYILNNFFTNFREASLQWSLIYNRPNIYTVLPMVPMHSSVYHWLYEYDCYESFVWLLDKNQE